MENNNSPSKNNPHGLTSRELEVAAAYLFATFPEGPVDYAKVALHGGYASADSARVSTRKFRDKFTAIRNGGGPAASEGGEAGEGAAPKPAAKPAAKRVYKKRKSAEGGAESGKRPRTTKKAAKAAEGDAEAAVDAEAVVDAEAAPAKPTDPAEDTVSEGGAIEVAVEDGVA